MTKDDRKYRQGRSNEKQLINEKMANYSFFGIVVILIALIIYNLSLSL